MQSIGHAQLRCQPLAVEFIGEHAVDDGPQKRAFVQRRPARNVQRGTGKLLAHGRQRPDDGVQVFQRVVALGQKQYRRAAKLPRMPQCPGVKQGAQRLVAGVVAGGGGQGGGGAAVKAGAAGNAAGLAQNGGFFPRQNVEIGLHVVQQFAGNDLINGVPQSAGMAVGVGHAVAQVRRAVPHHALDADEHRQVRCSGGILHGGGFGVLGAPDMHKVGLLGLQQGGKTIGTGDLMQLYPRTDRGFSPDYYAYRTHRGVSPDLLPQEYTGCNVGDFRLSCLTVADSRGAFGADFTYVSHTVEASKYQLTGLPCAHAEENDAETLIVRMQDETTGLTLELLYGVFAQQDVITRAARLTNHGDNPLRLDKAASACLDLPFGRWDLLHFHGRHAMERQLEREAVGTNIQTISSVRGSSSHHNNPFLILCQQDATETSGACYGVMMVYSGSYQMDVERSQTGLVRVVSGIQEERFAWNLKPGETFDTPEVILSFAAEGLTPLSQQYHRFLRRNICRGPWKDKRRPVLINNWEATYFDFNTEKIVKIAEKAASLGVEMMVLDDGWFGTRNDDNQGLGDWTVNCEKLPGGLDPLIGQINALGMKFGLWIEPEMVNENSQLYRTHPDWALTLPGRKPAMGRNQLVLDLSRPEVVDYLAGVIGKLLREHHIEYIKWDMNRSMSDVYSRAFPAEQQGEIMHRYMLGVYALAERLTQGFPEVLFEGCAGGGGRFDAGMLCYYPQIWCSDDTDAIERLTIQHGTSFGYPVCTMGAHVSACPNHQTGRTTPIDTRAVVAMSGTFGYELDLGKLKRAECTAVKNQIKRFKRLNDLIRTGDYYRLTDPAENAYFTAWQFAAEDGSEALLNLVVTHPQANPLPIHLCFRGLEEDAVYELDGIDYFGSRYAHDVEDGIHKGMRFSGSTLLYAGLVLPQLFGDYPSVQLHLTRKG